LNGLVWLLLLGLGLWGGWRLSAYWRHYRRQRRFQIGQKGEVRAERTLARAGYRILARQVERTVDIDVDGEIWECTVRADLLVERNGRTWVAEVKTGKVAPDPTAPTTRRQLMEYCIIFGVDCILLVDMEEDTIREIRFPLLQRRRWWWPFKRWAR